MGEMLPSNVEDPRFADAPAEPAAARVLERVVDGAADVLPPGLSWLDTALEFGGRVLQHVVAGSPGTKPLRRARSGG
jgi:hypothetical protein